MAATEVRRIAAHDSYLINLASPDPVLHARSLASFIAELRRSEALGIDYIVSHPGNYMDDRASGLARNIDAIAAALEQAAGSREGAHGDHRRRRHWAGRDIRRVRGLWPSGVPRLTPPSDGRLRRHMPRLRGRLRPGRATTRACGHGSMTWSGFDRLHMMHLNDSKFGLGTHRDRHELIGEGHLGEGCFGG